MKKKLIKTIKLDNGQVLKLFDASRRVAADRWFLSVIAEMDIAVGESVLGTSKDRPLIEDFKKGLGERVTFTQKRERIFIAENSKDKVFGELCDTFLNSCLNYLSHPDFPRKYIMKKYGEYQQRQSWYPS